MPTNNHGGQRKGSGRPPTGKPRKVKASISLDPDLLARIDAEGANRSATIEAALLEKFPILNDADRLCQT
jgi:hypothetical protein